MANAAAEGIDVAVIGADDLVGGAVLELLGESQLAIGRVHALGMGESVGDEVNAGERLLRVGDLRSFDFRRVRLVFVCTGMAPDEPWIDDAIAAGCAVIDGSGTTAAGVPLVVPAVNGDTLAQCLARGIVASPGSLSVMLAEVLKPLADAAGLERVEVASYESVSGAGREAMEELGRQTADLLNFREIEAGVLPRQVAFNLLPQVGAIDANGHCRSELALVHELRRLLGDDSLPVNLTAVRVPVFYGQAAAVHLETTRRLEIDEARRLLQAATGIQVECENRDGAYPTPVTDAAGSDSIFVGRLRHPPAGSNGLNLWVVSDNIRRGTAYNMLRIAERLVAAPP